MVHHAQFEPSSTVRYQSCERVDDESLSVRAPFEGMDARAYRHWFAENRLKRNELV